MLRRTRLAIVALVTGAVICAACSSGTDPASAETCGELEDLTIEMMQDMIDTLESEDVTIEEFESPTESPLSEDQMEEIRTQSDGIEGRWIELACPSTPSDVIVERADELTYTKRIGEYLVGQAFDAG